MTKSKRFYFQLLLWIGIWTALWLAEGSSTHFLMSNGLAFIFQAILLAGLIFFAAPVLLFKKKYLYFGLLSMGIILLFSWITFSISPEGPPHRPLEIEMDLPSQNSPPNRGPSLFFIHSITLALSYILATFLETFWFAQKKEEETIKNKNESLQTELKLLKSQINPHFLFNALNNIYSLSAINSEKTQQSISYLSDMLRYVLYECEQEWVSLYKEITYMQNYLKLFALKSSVPYSITTDFDIQDRNLDIAPMVLIPFLENALKHSNIEKRNGAFIAIKIRATTKEMLFEMENSIPKAVVQKDKVGGIGLENVKRRLAILYPQKHELIITNQEGVFKVILKIKVNEKE